MSQSAGRKLRIKRQGVYIAVVRTKTVAGAASPIDVTSDDDDGWRKLLDAPGTRSVDLSVEGVFDEDHHAALLAELLEGPWIWADQVELPDGGILSGDWRLNSVSMTGASGDPTTFSAELQSSGPISFTP
jgi:predicted secreted protein